MVLEPENEGVQSFFAVKAVASDGATQEHDYSDGWKSDDDNHWHKCDCGVKADSGKHSFVYGICSTCGFDSNNQKDNSSDSDLNSGTSAGNNSKENNNNINSD